MKRRSILLTILTIGVVLIVLNSTNAIVLSTTNFAVPSVGTINYHIAQRELGLQTWGAVPSQEIMDRLHPERVCGIYTWEGGTSYLDELIGAGIKHVVGVTLRARDGDHAYQMSVLQSQLTLSLSYPEVYGIYINDYFAEIDRGRTRAQCEEIVSTIRNTNPNLKIFIPWNYWSEFYYTNADEWLSWIEFDGVICNYYLSRLPDNPHPLEEMDDFHTRAENKFAGKEIWATANIRGIDPGWVYFFTAEEEYKYILNVLKDHYDAGKLVGIRIQSLPNMVDHPEYVDYIEEILIM